MNIMTCSIFFFIHQCSREYFFFIYQCGPEYNDVFYIFLYQCGPEYKLPGLYVVDSIVRQSRHQFGTEKDTFGPRFSKNFEKTFRNIFLCTPSDQVCAKVFKFICITMSTKLNKALDVGFELKMWRILL